MTTTRFTLFVEEHPLGFLVRLPPNLIKDVVTDASEICEPGKTVWGIHYDELKEKGPGKHVFEVEE